MIMISTKDKLLNLTLLSLSTNSSLNKAKKEKLINYANMQISMTANYMLMF